MQRLSRLIIETVPDLLWLKDINGVYLVCNPRVDSYTESRKMRLSVNRL